MKRAISAAAAVSLIAVLGLAGCGSSHTQRALSGGGIGAGVGAVGAAIIGAPVIGAAVIGGAAGAATGVLTDQDDIDLGRLLD